jgi:hypothetical protein
MEGDKPAEEGAGGAGGSAGRTGRSRGERSTGRGGAPTNRELEAAIAAMPKERLAALLQIAQAQGARGPATPKISHTLDTLDAEAAHVVIAACDEAIEYYQEAERNRTRADDHQAVAPIRDVAPEVVAAMFTNSAYRNKPIRHSVEVTRRYLASRHGDDTAAGEPS